MQPTIKVGRAGGGLLQISGPGGEALLTPDDLVTYLRAGGRPRLSISVQDLANFPLIGWLVDVGLTRGVSVVLSSGKIVDWSEVKESAEAYTGVLPVDHPVRKLLRLLPKGAEEAIASYVARRLHPDEIDSCIDHLDPAILSAWLPKQEFEVFEQFCAHPAGFFGRCYRHGDTAQGVSARLLVIMGYLWRKSFVRPEAHLDKPALDLWLGKISSPAAATSA